MHHRGTIDQFDKLQILLQILLLLLLFTFVIEPSPCLLQNKLNTCLTISFLQGHAYQKTLEFS